ncbi:hypothetical protein HZA56_11960 [Candidatus Poribacteria bacterium]|nr:hypothetical protein [Candidatus Poribacteria bacterium]
MFFFVLIPLIIYAAFYDSNIDGALDLFHEGEALAPAAETLRDKLPFRDIYLQHGWGVNLLRTRLAFSLFGVSVAANRRLSNGDVSGYLVPVVWIVVYLLLYSLFRNKLWIIPTFVLLVFADVMINERHLLPFLSMTLLVAGRRATTASPSGKSYFDAVLPLGARRAVPSHQMLKSFNASIFFAGVLAAAMVFYSLDTGVYACAIGVAFILLSAVGDNACGRRFLRDEMVSYCLGALVGALPFLAYLIWRGILDDFILNCYLQLRFQKETWGIPLPPLSSLKGPFENSTARNRVIYVIIKWYYPMFVYACAVLALLPELIARKLNDDDTALLLCTLAGIIFYRSAAGRADEGHIMYALGPFWILNICFLERVVLFRKAIKRQRGGPDETPPLLLRFQSLCFSYLAFGFVVLGLVLYYYATCRNGGIVTRRFRLREWKESGLVGYSSLNIERAGGVHVPSEQAQEVEKVVAFITSHAKPDEPIFDFSNQGAYYFLADRTNPTPYCQIAYAAPASMQAEALRKLEDSPPALVLMREGEVHKPEEKTPLIYEWIMENYREAARVGPNIMLLRN